MTLAKRILKDSGALYTALLGVFVACFVALLLGAPSIKAARDAHAIAAHEKDYLTALRNSGLGCRTLFARRPQIVVLGDSHTYAGIDFLLLQKLFGKTVGACAMGGAYVDSLPALIAKVAVLQPERIIIGMSPRMFWNADTREAQIETHTKLVEDLESGMARLQDVFMPVNFSGRATDLERRLKRHGDVIEALSERTVWAALKRSGEHVSLATWTQRLKSAVHRSPQGADLAAEICKAINKSGVPLSVFYVPESPFLEAQYKAALWRGFTRDVSAMKTCADHVVLERSVALGLGNRHFVNRYLDDSVSYDPWRSGGQVSNPKAFDADHMNPIGARIFTRHMANILTGASDADRR